MPMRLKIKYSSTKKFVLNFAGTTLGELTLAVQAFVADTYGEEWSGVLSLNGRDPLLGSANTNLQDLGIVASDLLTALPNSIGLDVNAGGIDVPHIGAGAGGGGAGGDSSIPTAFAAGSSAADRSESRSPETEAPTTLLDARDGGVPPPSLALLLSRCRPTTAGQVVSLLTHLTMLECRFVGGQEPGDGGRSISMPAPGWDGPVASLAYTHRSFPGFSCTVVLVTMGATKQILVSFPLQEAEISTRVNVQDYCKKEGSSDGEINSEDLRNVSKLSQKLRNELLLPLQLEAHRILGLPSPFHIAGLPYEVMIVILKYMDVRSTLRLSQCCRRLRDAVTDDALWHFYYRRDFREAPLPANDEHGSYMEQYKKRYNHMKRLDLGWKHKNLPDYVIPQFPHPRIYPTGPLYPNPSPTFPYPGRPEPIGPYPTVPDPTPGFNPYSDPDSPYYGGEIPNAPPNPLRPPQHPNPLLGGDPLNPFGDPLNPFGDPLNPFGDPSFGGLGPGLPRRPGAGGRPRGGPGFRYI